MLTLARKTELGIQPKVQYEIKPRVEWQPQQPRGTPAFAEETATRALEKLNTDEIDGGRIGRRESPEGEEDQDIIQGRTFKMLQKATESPDGQSWPSRLASGGAADGDGKSGSSPALNLRRGEQPQQEAGSSLRRTVVQMKPTVTEQTTILMSDATASSMSQKTQGQTTVTQAMAASSMSQKTRSQTTVTQAIAASSMSPKTQGQTTVTQAMAPSTKVTSLSANSFSISQTPATTGATSFTVSPSNSSTVQKAASFDTSQGSTRQATTQRSLSNSVTNPSQISEETSPWLQKADNGECQDAPKPPESTELRIIDDDDVQPIRQGRTFRLLAQATTNDPPADAYKAVFEEGKLSRAHKK